MDKILKMRSLVSMRHDGQSVQPGDEFRATAVDAPFLVAAQHAVIVEATSASAPIASVPIAPATNTGTGTGDGGNDEVSKLLEQSVPVVVELLPALSDDEYAALKAAEAAGKNRKGLADAFAEEDQRRADAAGAGNDSNGSQS